MIKVIHDSLVCSLKEIMDQGPWLKGAIIETFNTYNKERYFFLVVDTEYDVGYLDLDTLEICGSPDRDREYGEYNFTVHKEPYIEVKLRKVD